MSLCMCLVLLLFFGFNLTSIQTSTIIATKNSRGSDTIYPSDLKCDSILNCFLIIIDKCFKYDGGIGGYLAAINEHKEMKIDYPIVYKRIVFDALFYILLLIVLVNIISGIIIDTFSVLRIKKAIYINDLRDVCFICGYGKEEIDMVSEKDGFRHHIKKVSQ